MLWFTLSKKLAIYPRVLAHLPQSNERLHTGRRPFTSEASAEALLQASIVSRCHPGPEPWPPSSSRGSVGEAPRSSTGRWVGEVVFHSPKTRLLCFKPVPSKDDFRVTDLSLQRASETFISSPKHILPETLELTDH